VEGGGGLWQVAVTGGEIIESAYTNLDNDFQYLSRITSGMERNFSSLLSSLFHTAYQKCSLLWAQKELALMSVCEVSSWTSSSLKVVAIDCF
jgi:hypothetical protein